MPKPSPEKTPSNTIGRAPSPASGLSVRITAAAEAAIDARSDAGPALHSVDQRVQELLLVLPAAIDGAEGELRADLIALRDLLL